MLRALLLRYPKKKRGIEMLSEVIDMYIKARQDGNVKEQERIEKKLSRIGMDKMTLMVIVKEKEKENKNA